MRNQTGKRYTLVAAIMSLVLVIAVCLSFTWVGTITAAAQTKGYLALGDSITYGYGLGTDEDCYVDIFATDIGATSKTNAGVSGLTAATLTLALDSANTTYYNAAYKTAIEAADVITITIGGNDLMAAFYAIVAEIMGGSYTAESVSAVLSNPTGTNLLTAYSIFTTINSSDYGATITSNATFKAAVATCITNVNNIAAQIKSFNSDVVILIANQYNPYQWLDSTAYANIISLFEAGVIYYNSELKTAATANYTLVDVYTPFHASTTSLTNAEIDMSTYSIELDFHPNAAGHKIIAAAMEDAYNTDQVTFSSTVLKSGNYLNSAMEVVTTQPTDNYAYYKDGVLTLNNFTTTQSAELTDSNGKTGYYSLYATNDLTIILSGGNTLAQGIYMDGGNLTIKAASTGGDSLSLCAADSGKYDQKAIFGNEGTITITSYAKVVIGTVQSDAVWSRTKITISEKAEVEVGSAYFALYRATPTDSTFLDEPVITIDNATFHAKYTLYNAIRVNNGNVLISNGSTVNIDQVYTTSGTRHGINIYTAGSLTVSDSALTIGTVYADAIHMEAGDLIFSGSTVTINTVSGGHAINVVAGDFTMENTTLAIGTVGTADKNAINVKAGKITSTACTVTAESVASGITMYANEDISISGGSFAGTVKSDGSVTFASDAKMTGKVYAITGITYTGQFSAKNYTDGSHDSYMILDDNSCLVTFYTPSGWGTLTCNGTTIDISASALVDDMVVFCREGGTVTHVAEKSPTCTTTGTTAYYVCTTHGNTTEQVTLPVQHTYGEPSWTWTGTTAATAAFTCSVCTEGTVGHTVTVTAEITSEVTTAATCDTTGVMTYTATITYNGTTYSDSITEEITVQHTAGEAVKENEVAATCTANGSYESVVYCSVCGEEISRETITVSATGHTAGEAVKENEAMATCTADGSYESVVYCSVCGTEISRETVTTTAAGHSYGTPAWVWADDYSSATATFTCSVCGDKQELTATITSEVTTEATKSSTGVRTYTATVTLGGSTYTNKKTEEIAKLKSGFGCGTITGADGGIGTMLIIGLTTIIVIAAYLAIFRRKRKA